MKNAKKQIQQQLLEKMKVQDIHTIKVNHLVKSINISRSTFYLYYDSVFTVLQDIEDTFFNELKSIANNFWSYPPNNHYLTDPHPIILKVMIYLRDYKEISKILWGPYGDQTFKIRCRKMIKQAFFPEHIFQTSQNPDIIYNIVFMTGGHLELVTYWINNDCSYDIKKLTLLIYKLMYEEYR